MICSFPTRVLALLVVTGCGMDMSKPPSSRPIPAISGDAVFVVNGADNSVSVIDAASNTVLGTIALENAMYPHHIYLSADRARMLIAIPGMDLSGGHELTGNEHMPGAVLLMEAATGATKAASVLDTMNHNAIFSPDGREVWTSQMMMPGKVLILDAGTLNKLAEVAVGDMPAEITFSRDGRYAFVANGMSNDVTVVDAATKSMVKTISVGQGPVGAWPGVDGMMYVDCEEGKIVAVIDPSTLGVARMLDLGFMPGMVGTPPGGNQVWVTDADNGKVVFFDMQSGARTADVSTGAGAHGIAFSADGTKAYVTNQMADTVSVIDVASHTVTTTIQVGKKPNGIVFRAR